MSEGSVAKDGRRQVVGSQEDSIVGVSQRPEGSNRHGTGREGDREGVPGWGNSTGKGMGQTAAFSSTQASLTLPFNKYRLCTVR